jgi:hypothetical protein
LELRVAARQAQDEPHNQRDDSEVFEQPGSAFCAFHGRHFGDDGEIEVCK